MSNPFDQFDNQANNPFDQFDEKGIDADVKLSHQRERVGQFYKDVGNNLIGVGQTAASFLSQIPAMPLGFVAGVMQKANDPKNVDFQKQVEANIDTMTYNPARGLTSLGGLGSTEAGAHYTKKVGKVLNETIPAVAHLGVTQYPTMGQMVFASKAKRAGKVVDTTVPQATAGILDELNGKTSETATQSTVQWPPSDKPRKARPVEPLPTKPLTPMESMVEQLGGDPRAIPTTKPSPAIAAMVEDLGKNTPEARAAQAAIDARNEAMVADTTLASGKLMDERARAETLAQEAAARQQMENAPVYSPEHLKMVEEQTRLAEEQAAAQRQAEAQAALEARQAELEAGVAQARGKDEAVTGVSHRRMGPSDEVRSRQVAEAARLFDEGGGVTYLRNGLTKDDFVRAVDALSNFINESTLKKIMEPPSPKNRARFVLMTPDEFHDLALKFGMGGPDQKKLRDIRKQFDAGNKLSADTQTIPWLTLVRHKSGLDFVSGHEGRHRAIVLKERGVPYIPVELRSDRIRWSEQAERQLFDYIENYPKNIHTQDAWKQVQMWGDARKPGPITQRNFPVNQTNAPRPFQFSQAGLGKKQGGAINLWQKPDPNSPLGKLSHKQKGFEGIGNSMIETPEQAITLAKEVPDVKQNPFQKASNLLTKGSEYLRGRINHPVFSYTIDRLKKAQGEGQAQVAQLVHGDYLPALRALSKEELNQAAQILMTADLNQKIITPEMMEKYGLSEGVKRVIDSHQRAMKAAFDSDNAALIAAGKEPIKERRGYSAFNTGGDYVAEVRLPKKHSDGSPILDKDGNPVTEVVGVISSNFDLPDISKFQPWSIDQIKKYLADKNPEYIFGETRNKSLNRRGDNTPGSAAVAEALEAVGKDNPAVKDFLENVKEMAKNDPFHFMGMDKHTLQKKGVFGTEGRKPWLSEHDNAIQFFDNQVRYMENALVWGKLSEAALDVNKVFREKDVAVKAKNAVALGEEYLARHLGIDTSKSGKFLNEFLSSAFDKIYMGGSVPRKGLQFAKTLASAKSMGWSPSFLAANSIQGALNTPAMIALLKGRGLASTADVATLGWASIGRAGKYQLDSWYGRSVPEVFQKAMEYAEKNHVYATDMVQRAKEVQKNTAYWAERGLHGATPALEFITRQNAYLTMVDILHNAGVKPKDGLYAHASEFTNMVMGNYNRTEIPAAYAALGPIGNMAAYLRTYTHNELSRWAMFAREIPNNGNFAPLAIQMASTIATAGLIGLPMFSLWAEIYDTLTEKAFGAPRSLTGDIIALSEEVGNQIGDKWQYALSHGLGATVDLDLSRNLGLGEVFPSTVGEAAFTGIGTDAAMVKGVYDFVTSPSKESAQKLAVSVAPGVVGKNLQAEFYYKDGNVMSSDPKKRPKVVAEYNDADKFAKRFGFMGINESVGRTKSYENDKLDMAWRNLREKALNKVAQDVYNGRDVSESIQKYIDAQGDPASLLRELDAMAVEQNIPSAKLRLIKSAASSSITQLYSAQRRSK